MKKTLIAATGAACLLALPATAGAAEFCTGPAGTPGADPATAPVTVTLGRAIGPVALGMTKRAITDRVGAPPARAGKVHRWTVSGVPVHVQFGAYGRARSIYASSNSLTIEGVPLAAGAAAIREVAPRLEEAMCGEDRELFGAAGLPTQTSLSLPADTTARQGKVALFDTRIARTTPRRKAPKTTKAR